MIDVSAEDTLDESTLGKSECRIWCNKNLLTNTMKSIYSLESLILLRSSDACIWTAGIKHSLGIILGTFFTEGHIKYKMIQKKGTEKGQPPKASSTLHSFILFEPDVLMFLHFYSFGNLKGELNESLTVLEKKLDELKPKCKMGTESNRKGSS